MFWNIVTRGTRATAGGGDETFHGTSPQGMALNDE